MDRLSSSANVRVSHAVATDPTLAARELHSDLDQPDIGLILFFCSSNYDLTELSAELRRLFEGVEVVGCTTAGEIGPRGYGHSGLVGVSFPSNSFRCVAGRIDGLREASASESLSLGRRLLNALHDKAPDCSAANSFAFLLIDGLSVREEIVAHAIQIAIGDLPLIGGSAGDSCNFRKTYVYSDGCFETDRAVLILVNSDFPVQTFKTQHFVPSATRLVITGADVDRRIVTEIDGWPAAYAYAQLMGVEVKELDSDLFASSPVVVLIDGNNYVRSIQKANSDGSLTFFCAIEEGVVLRVAHGVDLVSNLEQAFTDIQRAIGQPQLVVGCDCILRRLEVNRASLEERVGAILKRNNTIGFNTYGEQFRGIHVNQTLTGVAIGDARPGTFK